MITGLPERIWIDLRVFIQEKDLGLAARALIKCFEDSECYFLNEYPELMKDSNKIVKE